MDTLQEKIRKTKNPSVLELAVSPECLPPHLMGEDPAEGYGRFCRELLANHIRTCVARDIREGNDETIDELLGILQKMMK